MESFPLVWILMGVSGSGKSLIGRLLSEQWDCDFLEGDRRHSPANLQKMVQYIPLDDHDRRQWLLDLRRDIDHAIQHQRECVLTCSALKHSYRKQLAAAGRVQWIFLQVSESELERRLTQRPNHYLKWRMLQSQLATFEPIDPSESVITVDGHQDPAEIVKGIGQAVTERFPRLIQPWWQRSLLPTS